MMFGQLIPVGGGDSIPLLKDKLLVGRRSSCDITLDFPNVSSHHCQLEMVNGYWHVHDLNSRNGTKVNGERVLERFIQPGDTIAFAKHRFEINYTPDPSQPPPEERDPFAVSLLEKAGLASASERRPPKRTAPGPLPPSSRPVSAPAPDPNSDEDKALKWLSDED
jgi:adenylate cyclase